MFIAYFEKWMDNPVVCFLVVWLAVVSMVSMIVTVSDKEHARKGAWRVRESTLLILAAMGGSAAMLFTMLVIRHKTKHIQFMWGIPLMMVFQAVAVVWLWWKMNG